MYGIQTNGLNITNSNFFTLSRVHEFNVPLSRIDSWAIDKISPDAKSEMEKFTTEPYKNGFVDVSFYEDLSYAEMRNKKDFHIVNVTNNIPFRMFAIQTMIPNNFEGQTLDWLVPSTLYPFFRVETRKARLIYTNMQEVNHHHFKIYEYATSFNDVARFGEYGFQTWDEKSKQTFLMTNVENFQVLNQIKISPSLEAIKSGIVFAQYEHYNKHKNNVPMVDKNFKPFSGWLPDINNLHDSPSAKANIPYYMYVDAPTTAHIETLKKHGRYHYYS